MSTLGRSRIWQMSFRWLTTGLASLALAAACGRSPGGEAKGGAVPGPTAPPRSAGGGGGGLATAATLASCGGFGPAQAAELLGAPASAITDSSSDITPTLRMCTFSARDASSQMVSFSMSLEESVDEAKRTYAQMKDNIPIAQHAQESAGVSSDDSALVEIGGLGDEALWTSVNGALTVRHGNLTIQVMAPRDRKKQIAVADKLLALMR